MNKTAFDLQFPANSFVDALGRASVPGFRNPWNGTAGATRRRNLVDHLRATCPTYLFIGANCSATDAGVSGVPFAPESAVLAGMVPRVKMAKSSTPVERTMDDGQSEDLWRSLHASGEAGSTLCFAVMPFLPEMELSSAADWSSEARKQVKWVAHLARWYRSIEVVALGEQVSEILLESGITHRSIRCVAGSGVNVRDTQGDTLRIRRAA